MAPCGTEAAIRRHSRHGEPLDEACAEKSRQIRAARYARDVNNRTEPVRQAKKVAKARALRKLAERHLTEYTLLLADEEQDELERKGLI